MENTISRVLKPNYKKTEIEQPMKKKRKQKRREQTAH
jgi:hypothetical protein